MNFFCVAATSASQPFGGRDVAGDGERLHAVLLGDATRLLLQAVLLPRGHDDVRALGGEPFRDRQPDADARRR